MTSSHWHAPPGSDWECPPRTTSPDSSTASDEDEQPDRGRISPSPVAEASHASVFGHAKTDTLKSTVSNVPGAWLGRVGGAPDWLPGPARAVWLCASKLEAEWPAWGEGATPDLAAALRRTLSRNAGDIVFLALGKEGSELDDSADASVASCEATARPASAAAWNPGEPSLPDDAPEWLRPKPGRARASLATYDITFALRGGSSDTASAAVNRVTARVALNIGARPTRDTDDGGAAPGEVGDNAVCALLSLRSRPAKGVRFSSESSVRESNKDDTCTPCHPSRSRTVRHRHT